uniref:Uncharacterized protein n=1 Tax=Panagrolaimus davidi TaxID=227884 RepID=A0A914PN67_9BILA
MAAFTIFSLFFVGAAVIAQIDDGNNHFLHVLCTELHATPVGQTYNSTDAAMDGCVETDTCIGFKRIAENVYQRLYGLTGYEFDDTQDYFLWDKSNGETYPNAPSLLDTKILPAIYPTSQCPIRFDVISTPTTLCRGSITSDICYSYPTYMAPQYDGTNCHVLTKQSILDKWA